MEEGTGKTSDFIWQERKVKMAVQELRVVEERCDRCELLIARRQLDAGGEVVSEKVQAENTGRFFLSDDKGQAVINYDVVCDRCRTLLTSLVDKMGKVNRGTRNRPKKKKAQDGDLGDSTPTPKKSVPKKKK